MYVYACANRIMLLIVREYKKFYAVCGIKGSI